MTESQLLLAAAIVAGFVLLALTVGAFVVARQRLGLALLVLAAVSFVGALLLMGRVSSQWEHDRREAVTTKYAVKVKQWGAPLGSDPEWKVNGKVRKECVVLFPSPDDPTFECDGKEMPLRPGS